MRELAAIKERLRVHGYRVAYGPEAPSLGEYLADIRRRDEIERLLSGR